MEINYDIINTIFPIVSIMIAFILSITTYLTSTPSVKVKNNSLVNTVKSNRICEKMEKNINIKKHTLKEVYKMNMLICLCLIILSIMIVFKIQY